MKRILLLIALLIGFSDGSIIVFKGYPLIAITPTEIVVEGVQFPVESVKLMRYVPDSMVM